MKIATAAALMGMTMFATAAMAQDLPNLEGKEVVVVWGEENGGSAKPRVEPHVQTNIRAVVHENRLNDA